MFRWAFHRWEEALHNRSSDRIVREFDWGLEWLHDLPHTPGAPDTDRPSRSPAETLQAYAAWAVAAQRPVLRQHRCARATTSIATATCGSRARSSRRTPRTTSCTRACIAPGEDRGRAVVVLPQWNSDADGHVGLCKLFNRVGTHGAPSQPSPTTTGGCRPELQRADYIVSSNVGRTLQVCRQAVLDARRAVGFLHAQGYSSIGICGTSLGSCLSMLTAAHEPRIKAAALNHISPLLRRRGVGGPLDPPRAPGPRRTRRSRHAATHLGADQPAPVPRARAGTADAARVRAVRPHVPAAAVEVVRAGIPATAASRTSSPCCRAVTTARASRRSSSSTATGSRSSWPGRCKGFDDRR